jgi:hypothetical protein
MLQDNLIRAEDALYQALVTLLPRGTVVTVKLLPAQVNPTRGTVISHGYGRDAGAVRLRLHTKNYLVRDFPWKDIIEVVHEPDSGIEVEPGPIL